MEVNHMIFYICHFLLSSSSSFFFQNFNVRIMSWSPTCYYFGILDRQFKSEIEKDKIALHGWWQHYVPQIIIFTMRKWCVLGQVHLKVHSENHTEYNWGFAFTQEPGRALKLEVWVGVYYQGLQTIASLHHRWN